MRAPWPGLHMACSTNVGQQPRDTTTKLAQPPRQQGKASLGRVLPR